MNDANHKEAFKAYQKASEVNPNYASAYFGMASC